MKYREEIDGLRAVALIPVIFFHAGFRVFSGGYVGVDIFFVISGYLITSLLIERLESGTFSLLEFYERRARRILPALYITIVCCALIAWMLLFPLEMKVFGESALSVGLFISNVYFWFQSGYFENAAHFTPLLHTWSLAVEEQYYFLFPILFCGAFRLCRRKAFGAVVVVAGFSFVSFVVSAWYEPNFSFFSTPTRAWELMVGSICAFVPIAPITRRANCLSILGLVLIVVRVFTQGTITPALSVFSLAPVVGTAAIILYGREGTFAARILSLRVLVGIGLISYSAYLWHQPLLVFTRIVSITPPSGPILLASSAASLLLGYASWRFIERPFRERGASFYVRRASMIGFASTSSIVVIILGLWAHLSGGFPERISPDVLAIASAANDFDHSRQGCVSFVQNDLAVCHLGVAGKAPDFALIGDSFARALASGINSAALDRGQSGIVVGVPGCPPIVAIGGIWAPARERCSEFQKNLIQGVARLGVTTAILYANWSVLDRRNFVTAYKPDAANGADAFRGPLIATLSDLTSKHIKVFIVCCSPELTFPIPQALARAKLLGSSVDIRPYKSDFLTQNRTALSLFSSPEVSQMSRLIDISGFFCRSDRCDVALEGRPLYHDQSHLNQFGAESLSPWLEQIFDEKL
jgi:peptidoglycan/LPS O-acetylase OafA/YrhL